MFPKIKERNKAWLPVESRIEDGEAPGLALFLAFAAVL